MRVIVTTGRTEEALTTDGAVITNGFTGRQGQEIARAFLRHGAEVVIVSGPTALPDVNGARTVHVRTMREMRAAVLREIGTPTDIYVSAAAIADFSLAAPLPLRLAPGEAMTLQMEENPSLVAEVAEHAARPRVVVSFAAQSAETLMDYALEKFAQTGADMTVANPIGGDAATARDSARNEAWLIFRRNGETLTEKLDEAGKDGIAEVIAGKALEL